MEGGRAVSDYEAQKVLEFFTDANAGDGAMDGAGQIWRFDGEMWQHKRSRVTPVKLAAALNPDLAHHWRVQS